MAFTAKLRSGDCWAFSGDQTSPRNYRADTCSWRVLLYRGICLLQQQVNSRFLRCSLCTSPTLLAPERPATLAAIRSGSPRRSSSAKNCALHSSAPAFSRRRARKGRRRNLRNGLPGVGGRNRENRLNKSIPSPDAYCSGWPRLRCAITLRTF